MNDQEVLEQAARQNRGKGLFKRIATGDIKDAEHPVWELQKHPAIRFVAWFVIVVFLAGGIYARLNDEWKALPQLKEDVKCLKEDRRIEVQDRENMKDSIRRIEAGVDRLTEALLNRAGGGRR